MATKYLDKVGLAYFWSKIKAWCNSLFALDSDVIHKNSNEAIDGIKEFSNSYYDSTRPNESNWESSSLIIRYKNYIKGSGAPSANKYANLLFLDKVGSNIDWEGRLSSVESGVFPDGENHTRLICYKNQIISETEPRSCTSITIGYDPDGIRFAGAPSTSEDRTQNTDILTRDWIPKDTRIVHTSGAEDIYGIKTFKNAIRYADYITCDLNYITIGTAPSSEQTAGIFNVNDSNKKNLLRLYLWYGTNKSIDGALLVYKGTTPDSGFTGLHVGYDGDGLPFSYAPSTRTDRNNGSDIVTRDFIPKDTRIVHTTGNETIAGTKTFSAVIDGSINGLAAKATADSNGRNISTGYMWRGSYERIQGTSSVHKDLNDYKVAGFYNIKTQYIDNCPTGVGVDAVLLVYPWQESTGEQSNKYLTQELTESAASGDCRRWIRKLNNGTWSAWKQVAFTESSITGNAATATKLTTARTINGVSFDGSANITVADSTKLPLAGGTVTGDITMSASKSIVFDLSATTPTVNSPRSLPIQFKSKSIDNDYVFTNYPFFEIPLTQDANYGMGIGFGAGGLTLIGGGEAGRGIVVAESLTGGNEQVIIAADSTVDFYTNCNTIANRVKTSINTSGNFTGKASNVTGTVAIANGGTGATTRLNAIRALTNENVGTDSTFFLTITDSWGKAGFTSVNQAKTVLGLKSAAYTESSDYVHMSGNETVGGVKTFSEDVVVNKYIYIRNGDITSGTAPSSSHKYRDLAFSIRNSDNTGWDRSAYIEAAWYTTGNSAITMACYNLLDRSKPMAFISVGQTAGGGQYAKTVTPSANSNTTDIATTEWVNNKGYLTSHQSLANYVTLDGAQTIGGAKTFSSGIGVANSSPSFLLKDTNGIKGDASASWYFGLWFDDKNDKHLGYISVGKYGGSTDLHNAITFRTYTTASASDTAYFEVRSIWYTNSTCAFEPDASDHVLLGRSPRKWKEIWCTQSSINSSSDIRLKDDIANIPNEVLDAWEDIDWVQFKFKSAKQEKGFNARLHTGTIAQSVDKAFKDHGLNVNEYGLFLYDEWEEVPEVIGEDGTVQQKFQPAGNEYGLRYVEALCMEAAYQRRKNKILENRISELEKQVSDMIILLQNLTNNNG